MELKKLGTATKEEINKVKSELDHYQLALDNTKHSKRRQELEQKIAAAEEKLKEIRKNPETSDNSEDKTESDSSAEKDFSIVRNMATLIGPLNVFLFAGVGMGIGAGYLLGKTVKKKN